MKAQIWLVGLPDFLTELYGVLMIILLKSKSLNSSGTTDVFLPDHFSLVDVHVSSLLLFFAWVYVWAPRACLVATEVGSLYWIPWSSLWVAVELMWVLETDSASSAWALLLFVDSSL